MTDITKCTGEGCPLKETCYRFTAPAEMYQSYFMTPPVKNGQCEYHWNTNPTILDDITKRGKQFCLHCQKETYHTPKIGLVMQGQRKCDRCNRANDYYDKNERFNTKE